LYRFDCICPGVLSTCISDEITTCRGDLHSRTPPTDPAQFERYCQLVSIPLAIHVCLSDKSDHFKSSRWLVTYRNNCPEPGIEPGYGHSSQY